MRRRGPGIAFARGRFLLRCLLGCALPLLLLRSATGADLYDIAPAVPPRVVDDAFFGSHLHRAVAAPRSSAPPTPWPAGQVASLRLWDSTTRWADLEPAPGEFDFERLDAYVAKARSEHASLLMVLGSAPRWAAARPDEAGPYGPGSASEPARLTDWDRYVTAVARRYRGQIARYELWNEPYFSDLPGDRGHADAFFTGSVATMVELARRTRAILDREDPNAVLLTPGFVGGPERLDLFLGAGGDRFVGGVGYHFYADDDRGFIELQRGVRAVMARRGVAALPLLDTESGFAVADGGGEASSDSPARERTAELLARSMVLAAYLGIERFYQYAWDNERSGMLLPRTLAPTPSAAAFAAVRRWLVGTTLQGCRREADEVVHCLGIRRGDRLSIRWRVRQGVATVRLPASAQVLSAEYAAEPGRSAVAVASGAISVAVDSDPLAVWWRAPPSSGAARR